MFTMPSEKKSTTLFALPQPQDSVQALYLAARARTRGH